MFLQGSLLSVGIVEVDASATVDRVALDATSWVDVSRGWLRGSDTVFDDLIERLPWHQRRDIPMYDRLVDEPRLTYWWHDDHKRPEPLPMLAGLRRDLSDRYDVAFDSIGFNLYRTGSDSVAWHGDRHRREVTDPVVAILSVGAPRPLRLRPRPGGPAAGRAACSWDLGRGDLFVMGGACQHDWQHTIPKVRRAGPRISVTFRHDAARTMRP